MGEMTLIRHRERTAAALVGLQERQGDLRLFLESQQRRLDAMREALDAHEAMIVKCEHLLERMREAEMPDRATAAKGSNICAVPWCTSKVHSLKHCQRHRMNIIRFGEATVTAVKDDDGHETLMRETGPGLYANYEPDGRVREAAV